MWNPLLLFTPSSCRRAQPTVGQGPVFNRMRRRFEIRMAADQCHENARHMQAPQHRRALLRMAVADSATDQCFAAGIL